MTHKYVRLDIRPWQATTNDFGFHDATTSGGTTKYCYRYTGGDDGAGGLTHRTNSGSATTHVILVADQRYHFDAITFTGEHHSQLSPDGGAAYERRINNLNTADMDANYHVTVKDTGNNNVTISCDPPIRNVKPV